MTKNEILYSLNKPDDFILALVEFLDGGSHLRKVPAPALPARTRLWRHQRQLRLRQAAGTGRGPSLSSLYSVVLFALGVKPETYSKVSSLALICELGRGLLGTIVYKSLFSALHPLLTARLSRGLRDR